MGNCGAAMIENTLEGWMLAPLSEMGPPEPVCLITMSIWLPDCENWAESGVKVSSGCPPMQTGPAQEPPEMQALAFSQAVAEGAS